ncbi:YceI family protein [Sphingobacterium tabacisoli]|uniref:YceI family protein n=1 Tax=Sphingobacterium tabacisoli TaxID=2044855 RepID=A0ABW5L7Y1_9SPHI|nr:YceI family protein [Sphingobacterium tabacisoli]
MNLRKSFALLGFFTLLSLTTFAQNWTKDPMHSRLGFVVSRDAMLDVTGVFKDFDITMKANNADFSDAQVTVDVQTASIDTYVEMRDNHLRNADFLDVAKYPKMTFKSTGIKKVGADTYLLSGELTLHGVTKKLDFTMKHLGSTRDEGSKKDIAGFKVTGSFKRSDFGVGAKIPSPLVGDVVQVVVDVLMQK